MLYIAKAEVTVYPYMEETHRIEKNFIIDATSNVDAERKVKTYYEEKDEGVGGTRYSVNHVEFFEYIS